jgi:hypothetical protein
MRKDKQAMQKQLIRVVYPTMPGESRFERKRIGIRILRPAPSDLTGAAIGAGDDLRRELTGFA